MDLFEVRRSLAVGTSIYETPLRAVYYARVSTDKDEQLHSLAAQKEYFERFITQNSSWHYAGAYIDEGISGTKVDKRDQFLKMIQDAKAGNFDLIITKEISRFSRSTLDSIFYTQELLRYGVGVLFQNDNICTLDGDSELRLTIMASIAQDEVRKLSERCKFGFKRSVEKGTVLGNDQMWGYKKDKGRLIVVPEEADIIKMIFEMYVYDGAGIRRISQTLSQKGYLNSNQNPFSFSTIKGILNNPKYKGYYCGNKSHKLDYRRNDRKIVDKSEWVLYKDYEKVPPIISEELWDKANEILHKRSREMSSEDKKSYTNKYKYSGKIVCAKHQCAYQRTVYKYKSGDKELWQCREYAEKGKKGCDMPVIYTAEIDDLVKLIYRQFLSGRDKIVDDLFQLYQNVSVNTDLRGQMSDINKEINIMLERKDKLLDLVLNGKISDDEFQMQNNRYNHQIEQLKLKQTEYNKNEEKDNEIRNNVLLLRDKMMTLIENGDYIGHSFINGFIKKITVSENSDENNIHLLFCLNKVHQKTVFGMQECVAPLIYITKRGQKGNRIHTVNYIVTICEEG